MEESVTMMDNMSDYYYANINGTGRRFQKMLAEICKNSLMISKEVSKTVISL